MSAVGGSVETANIGGRDFSPTADSEAVVKLGGFEATHSANGDSTARKIKTRVTWSVTGLNLSMDESNGDLEFLQDIADNDIDVPCAFTFASGKTYQGVGSVSGELARSSQSASGPVVFTGPGKLTKQ